MEVIKRYNFHVSSVWTRTPDISHAVLPWRAIDSININKTKTKTVLLSHSDESESISKHARWATSAKLDEQIPPYSEDIKEILKSSLLFIYYIYVFMLLSIS